jgi:hypothetical protein
MNQKFTSKHETDKDGNPAGGKSEAVGIKIKWQDGPLGRGENRKEPNGAFVETLIDIVVDRLQYYQDSKFASGYNARAIQYLMHADQELKKRTADREAREVEGTHQK